jgi:hypothetical protein
MRGKASEHPDEFVPLPFLTIFDPNQSPGPVNNSPAGESKALRESGSEGVMA